MGGPYTPHTTDPSVPPPRIAVAVSLPLLLAESPRCSGRETATAVRGTCCSSAAYLHELRRSYFANNFEVRYDIDAQQRVERRQSYLSTVFVFFQSDEAVEP